jgi:transposase
VLIPLAEHARIVEPLEARVAELERENDGLREENARLKASLEKTRRAGKRQAAPFSKGKRSSAPKKPGRKPGKDYGRKGHREPPKKVDEIVDVPLPCSCPNCGSDDVEVDRVEPQFQAEVPKAEPYVTQFNVPVGHCNRCGGRLQGRHERQTSDALGAASSQLGPRSVAMAVHLQKEMGLSYGRVQAVFLAAFGIEVTRGGLAHAIQRAARRLTPTYDGIVEALKTTRTITPDETGWRVNGESAWLWIFVGDHLVVYNIAVGRSFEDATLVLPADYAGQLVRDGWSAYLGYTEADHQTCNNHLIRRCSEILETAQRGAARVPHLIKDILQDGLALRDRREDLSPHGFAMLKGKLVARLDRILEWDPTDDENRKLLNHIRSEHEIGAVFRYLDVPGLPATNHLAEQGIRPAVVNRKVSGGNRTWRGAIAQSILMTVVGTARRQDHDPIPLIETALRSAGPLVLPLAQGPPS